MNLYLAINKKTRKIQYSFKAWLFSKLTLELFSSKLVVVVLSDVYKYKHLFLSFKYLCLYVLKTNFLKKLAYFWPVSKMAVGQREKKVVDIQMAETQPHGTLI